MDIRREKRASACRMEIERGHRETRKRDRERRWGAFLTSDVVQSLTMWAIKLRLQILLDDKPQDQNAKDLIQKQILVINMLWHQLNRIQSATSCRISDWSRSSYCLTTLLSSVPGFTEILSTSFNMSLLSSLIPDQAVVAHVRARCSPA